MRAPGVGDPRRLALAEPLPSQRPVDLVPGPVDEPVASTPGRHHVDHLLVPGDLTPRLGASGHLLGRCPPHKILRPIVQCVTVEVCHLVTVGPWTLERATHQGGHLTRSPTGTTQGHHLSVVVGPVGLDRGPHRDPRSTGVGPYPSVSACPVPGMTRYVHDFFHGGEHTSEWGATGVDVKNPPPAVAHRWGVLVTLSSALRGEPCGWPDGSGGRSGS